MSYVCLSMKFLYILYFVLISNYSLAQLSIDSGGDTIILCQDNLNIISLGGNPTISGGYSPYIYIWSIASPIVLVQGSSIVLHASDFLDDTTASNPIIIDGYGVVDSLCFYLTVIDAIGQIQVDSSLVYFSMFVEHLSNFTYDLLAGDSILLNGANISSSFEPHTYLWQPNHGLTDSTSLSYYAKPDYSIAYYVTATNSLGCVYTGAPYHYINIHYLNIEDVLIQEKHISLYPNPSNGEVFLLDEDEIVKSISIFDMNNKLITNLNGNTNKFDLSAFPKGVYFIKIELEGQIITKKLILE